MDKLPQDLLTDKLPQDLLTDRILLKLPTNSLRMLKCVSKYLHNIISSRSFVYDHLHHSLNDNNPSLLISSRRTVLQVKNDYRFKTLNNNDPSLLISSPHSVLQFDDYKNRIKDEINHYTCNFNFTSSSTNNNNAAVQATEIAKLLYPLADIRASCNGLLYLHGSRRRGDDDDLINRKRKRNQRLDQPTNTIGYIWNPCTNEYKELPPAPPLTLCDPFDDDDFDCMRGRPSSSSGFCGFGYDRTNDEYKILYYENKVEILPYKNQVGDVKTHISSKLEFKLYTLGTNTWTSIVHNPYKSFYFKENFKRNKIGLLVNGALHWIMSLSDPAPEAGKIISFDIELEVFREVVQKPHYHSEKDYHYYESLQVLQECLCVCQIHPDRKIGVDEIDIWMLKDYNAMDSWTKLFKVMIPMGEIEFLENQFKLFRYYENNGEIVMLKNNRYVIVYNTVNHTSRRLKKLNEVVEGLWKYCMDYTASLVSLNSGTSRFS